jgi:DNA ligase-1
MAAAVGGDRWRELRHGALDGIVVEALACSMPMPPVDVRRAVMLTGDLANVARVAISEGIEDVGRYRVVLFRQVQPMLAEPADDMNSTLPRMEWRHSSTSWTVSGCRFTRTAMKFERSAAN